MIYEPEAGITIDAAVKEAFGAAINCKESVTFDFNGTQIVVDPLKSQNDNVFAARKAYGLPEVHPPFHPPTCKDALERYDAGRTVFSVDMGGLGPAYEHAIQTLFMEMVRDNLGKPLPEGDTFGKWGDDTVSRIDEKMGGYSGAMVGAAKQLAYKFLKDNDWKKTLDTAPQDRHIQICKHIPNL